MKRRRVLITVGVLVVIASAALFVLPLVLAPLSAQLVEGEWGGRVEVAKARWYGGKVIYLEGVEAFVDGQDAPMITAAYITVHLENNPIFGDPGLLLLGVLTGATLDRSGRLADFERVTYRRDGARRSLAIAGLDADFDWSAKKYWAEAVTRIVEAPGIAPEGGGPLLEALEIEDSRVDLLVDWREGKRRVPIQVDQVLLGSVAEKESAFDLEVARGRVLGGSYSAFGDLDLSQSGSSTIQINLVDLDLREAAGLELLAAGSSGSTTAYLNVTVTAEPDRTITGAGWLQGGEVRVWEEPHVSAMLDQLGLAAADENSLREVKGSVRLDRGRIYLTEMICIGSPLNLFGNGSCRMDGTDLQIGLVPRLFGESIDQKADAPQLLLDVLAGALVEIRVTGALKDPVVEVAPVSLITDPLRAFIGLFSSDSEPDTDQD